MEIFNLKKYLLNQAIIIFFYSGYNTKTFDKRELFLLIKSEGSAVRERGDDNKKMQYKCLKILRINSFQ